jgi:hypothetical protein
MLALLPTLEFLIGMLNLLTPVASTTLQVAMLPARHCWSVK